MNSIISNGILHLLFQTRWYLNITLHFANTFYFIFNKIFCISV